MIEIRLSGFILVVSFTVALSVLFLLRDYFLAAHINGDILSVSSDASVYFSSYKERFANVDVLKNWTVFLRASPILFMILSDGNLFLIQVCNLILMLVSLRVAFDCFATLRGRMVFLYCAILFPYFSFGFLGLNKEVYAMCSAIFYGSYMIRGRIVHLAMALILALAARYYMLASLLMLMLAIPRDGRPRWRLALAALLFISMAGPIAKSYIPEYSETKLLEGSGYTAILLGRIVDNFGYAFIYPFKYIIILTVRPYGYIVGSTHDAIGAIVSVLSIFIIARVVWLLLMKRLNLIVRQLIAAGFIAPIPMMWSEIMHWRYYSFVYFFFIYASILYWERDRRNVKEGRSTIIPKGVSVAGVKELVEREQS